MKVEPGPSILPETHKRELPIKPRYRSSKTVPDRFWPKVKRGQWNECWMWTGGKSGGNGGEDYGVLNLFMRGKRWMNYAHRVSWMLHFGEIPNNTLVLHRCDVRLCVNPDHLFLGDNSINTKDMLLKGRGWPAGSKQLTQDQVRSIKVRLNAGEAPVSISKSTGIKCYTIWSIRSGKTWRFIE